MTNFYHEKWENGLTDEAEITACLECARAIINSEIAFSGYTVDTVPPSLESTVDMAVHAQADYIISNGGIDSLSENSGGSYSLGKFSYSGGGSSENSNGTTSLSPMARKILAPTGLLYKGVNTI